MHPSSASLGSVGGVADRFPRFAKKGRSKMAPITVERSVVCFVFQKTERPKRDESEMNHVGSIIIIKSNLISYIYLNRFNPRNINT